MSWEPVSYTHLDVYKRQEVYSTNYDHDRSIKGNLGYVWEELSNMKQYQAKEVKQETSCLLYTSEDSSMTVHRGR